MRDNQTVQVRFLLGPAGSGKTWRCLAAVRAELAASPAGPPLVFLAPKQSTFQLERQLLADGGLAGYTRLHILSFDRLAAFVLRQHRRPLPQFLSEDGRVMVLRALLARRQPELRLFRGAARLPGFAQQLAALLREFQHHHLSPERLESLGARLADQEPLTRKLQDLALLLRAYRHWLQERRLHDPDSLLDVATETLQAASTAGAPRPRPGAALAGSTGAADSAARPVSVAFRLGGLWLDGFAEMTPQELDLLAALVPRCDHATVAFCLERPPEANDAEFSAWSVVGQTFRGCRQRLEAMPGCTVRLEVLARRPPLGRFAASPVLQHLERFWSNPRPFPDRIGDRTGELRVVACANPEEEAVLAAREIRRFARDSGGRYRDVAVLVRSLEGYHEVLRRVFTRYGVPFFLDRRESIAQHPLAELTRSAVRTVGFGWKHEDWFAALKTGLAGVEEEAIDELENEALARGWEGEVWLDPLPEALDGAPVGNLEALRRKVVAPFAEFAARLAAVSNRPTGADLARALRELWATLGVARQLENWSAAPLAGSPADTPPAVHVTAWEQMQAWVANLELAFAGDAWPLGDWLPVVETGLAGLTVGAIPPALDQVLIGTVDRSRNPDLQLVLLLGCNESVFPAPPPPAPLLTETDRAELGALNLMLNPPPRAHLGRERYYGYIGCTRPRRQLLLSFSLRDDRDQPRNPSTFVHRLRRLFPELTVESFHDPGVATAALGFAAGPRHPWRAPAVRDAVERRGTEAVGPPATAPPDSPCAPVPVGQGASPRGFWDAREHVSELAPLFVSARFSALGQAPVLAALDALPCVQQLRRDLAQLAPAPDAELLDPALAEALYGPVLQTSVSRLEQFAACPFRFFVQSGLGARERQRFELDAREEGSFQHEVLARFHRQLEAEDRAWRDLTPGEARDRIARAAAQVTPNFRDGLVRAGAARQFVARALTAAVQDFIEVFVASMHDYGFDPAAVELGFGQPGDPLPAWETDLGDGHRLALRGKIDRVDLARQAGAQTAFCVVMDYKSSNRQFDAALLEHGVQLQLPAYLAVLRHLAEPPSDFGVTCLLPVGVFYVNLRGRFPTAASRREALANSAAARSKAYQHTGRFDLAALRLLDKRPGATSGSLFKYRLTKEGRPHAGDRDCLSSERFTRFLATAEQHVVQIGREIFAGAVRIDPYQKGAMKACDHCDYASVCRVDPWTHNYRLLRPPSRAGGGTP